MAEGGRTNRPARLDWLVAELGLDPDVVPQLRYQLLCGVAAALRRAEMAGATRALFLAQTIESPETDGAAVGRNMDDLERLMEAMRLTPAAAGIAGPWHAKAGTHLHRAIDLYVGKVVSQLPKDA